MNWLAGQLELSRTGGESNIRSMEGLRGLAVFLVFLVHFVSLVEPWIDSTSNFFKLTRVIHSAGNTGVDLFFVLSGYLIYGSLITRSQSFFTFISKRIKRIYPAFLAVFVIYLVLSFVFPEESKIPQDTKSGIIYLLQNALLLPGLFPIEPMITVAWSLSYEIFYYLTIPAVIGILRLRSKTTTYRISFFLGLAFATSVYCLFYGGPVRLIMFIAGIILFENIQSKAGVFPSASLGVLALLSGLFFTVTPVPGVAKIVVLFISFFILCAACFKNPTGWLSHCFSWTPLRWLGNMSYSYYLIHGLTLKAAFLALSIITTKKGFDPWFFWALLPPMFLLTLISSFVLFAIVERPLSLSPKK